MPTVLLYLCFDGRQIARNGRQPAINKFLCFLRPLTFLIGGIDIIEIDQRTYKIFSHFNYGSTECYIQDRGIFRSKRDVQIGRQSFAHAPGILDSDLQRFFYNRNRIARISQSHKAAIERNRIWERFYLRIANFHFFVIFTSKGGQAKRFIFLGFYRNIQFRIQRAGIDRVEYGLNRSVFI